MIEVIYDKDKEKDKQESNEKNEPWVCLEKTTQDSPKAAIKLL